jgi:hypothetical protein
MYLNQMQLNSILQTPYYSLPCTESWTDYVLYRGQHNTSVYTVRFNVTAQFDDTIISETLTHNLFLHFAGNSRLLGTVGYDILLRDPVANPSSFYIWKANSNQHRFDQSAETVIFMTHVNVIRFARGINHNDINQLNLNFRNSQVCVDRILAIVCSFMLIHST